MEDHVKAASTLMEHSIVIALLQCHSTLKSWCIMIIYLVWHFYAYILRCVVTAISGCSFSFIRAWRQEPFLEEANRAHG